MNTSVHDSAAKVIASGNFFFSVDFTVCILILVRFTASGVLTALPRFTPCFDTAAVPFLPDDLPDFASVTAVVDFFLLGLVCALESAGFFFFEAAVGSSKTYVLAQPSSFFNEYAIGHTSLS